MSKTLKCKLSFKVHIFLEDKCRNYWKVFLRLPVQTHEALTASDLQPHRWDIIHSLLYRHSVISRLIRYNPLYYTYSYLNSFVNNYPLTSYIRLIIILINTCRQIWETAPLSDTTISDDNDEFKCLKQLN